MYWLVCSIRGVGISKFLISTPPGGYTKYTDTGMTEIEKSDDHMESGLGVINPGTIKLFYYQNNTKQKA